LILCFCRPPNFTPSPSGSPIRRAGQRPSHRGWRGEGRQSRHLPRQLMAVAVNDAFPSDPLRPSKLPVGFGRRQKS
jgi:hypothetical protein